MMHLPHSAHLFKRKEKISLFPISFMKSTAYFCMKLNLRPLNIVSLHPYLLNEVIATSQFMFSEGILIHSGLKYIGSMGVHPAQNPVVLQRCF